MNTREALKKRTVKRIVFTAAGTLIISALFMLVFYTLFLIFPYIIIKTGVIAPSPLITIWLLSLALPFSIFLYRFPFFGKKFYNSIIKGTFSAADIKTAVELDRRQGYPAESLRKEETLSAYLAKNFSEKVSSSLEVKEKNIFSHIFTSKLRVAAALIILIIAAGLSIMKTDFLSDIITALRTGLPTELISTGPVIEFEKIEARIIPPAYLESRDIRVVDLKRRGKIKTLEGSKVIISGILKGVTKGELFFSTDKGLEHLPVSIKEINEFETSFLAPTKGAFALEFDRSLNDKKSTEKSRVYRVETYPDMPPEIKIFAPEKEHKIVYGSSFGITFAASDDYGLLEINLLHREADSESGYHRELITRFPREAKKQYNTTYIWNPILKDGEKFQELVYHPGTEKVEYYIEVRDINIFSNKGVSKSETMYVTFTNLFSELKSATDLIKELIRDGKELSEDIKDDRKIQAYREKLQGAIEKFSDELRDILPRSSLINESRKMHNALPGKDKKVVKEKLDSYVTFLERYLNLLNFLMKNENLEMAERTLNKTSSEFESGNYESAFKSLASIAEMLGKDIMKELDEIQKLIDKGDIAEAQERMEKLIKEIQDKLHCELNKYKTIAMGMAKEALKKLEEIIASAKERIKEENKNISTTGQGRIQEGISAQQEINKKLAGLTGMAEKLASENPLVLGNIHSYARTAETFGKQSLTNLERKKTTDALRSEQNVVRYLEALINESEQQKQQLQQMAKGNFNMLMPQDRMSWFVFIPKEAVYTVPVQYKDRIIDMSKERSKSTEAKESFWRDVLE